MQLIHNGKSDGIVHAEAMPKSICDATSCYLSYYPEPAANWRPEPTNDSVKHERRGLRRCLDGHSQRYAFASGDIYRSSSVHHAPWPRFLISCLYACLFLLIASTFLFHGRLIYQLFNHESHIFGIITGNSSATVNQPTHLNKHPNPSQFRVDHDSILIGLRSRNLKLGRRVWMLRIKPLWLFVPAPPLLKAPLARTSNPLSTVCFSKPYGLDLQCRTKIDTSTV